MKKIIKKSEDLSPTNLCFNFQLFSHHLFLLQQHLFRPQIFLKFHSDRHGGGGGGGGREGEVGGRAVGRASATAKVGSALRNFLESAFHTANFKDLTPLLPQPVKFPG